MPVKVHVNSNVIRSNRKQGRNDPPLTIRRGTAISRHHSVRLIGEARIVYQPEKPLACGAQVWVVCDDAIGD